MKITPEVMAECKQYADGSFGHECGTQGRVLRYWYREACLNCGEPFLASCIYKKGVRILNEYCSKECVDSRTLSDETKEKMRQSHLGKTVSVETREKIGKASRGKPRPAYVITALHSAEARAKALAGRLVFVQQNGGGNMKPNSAAAKHNLYRHYKQKAQERGLPFDLSEVEFITITSQKCYYCGVKSSMTVKNHATCTTSGFYICNGIDRVDSTKGYAQGNVVPCCSSCNVGKLKRTVDAFITWAYKVATFRPKKNIRTTYAAVPSATTTTIEKEIYYGYTGGAKKRKLSFALTYEQFVHLIKRCCYYCGAPPFAERHNRSRTASILYTGIDRVDSAQGYVIDNVVSCCRNCNWAKGTKSVSEFYAWVNRVVAFQDSLKNSQVAK
jgi:hypothetical protein